MPYELKVDMPNLSQGDRVGIYALGEFEQGVAQEVSDEQAEIYAAMTGRTLEEVYNDKDHPVAGITLKKMKAKAAPSTPEVPEGGNQ